MQIINQARTNFEYKLSQNTPIIRMTVLSNKVSTNVIENMLCSRKYTDKQSATLFDTLTYTITITNTGSSNITNIYFQDILPGNLRFITNSLIINGKKINCLNPLELIKLEDITPSNTTTISFKSIVARTNNSSYIENYSAIYFDYIYNIEKPPIQLKQYTNTVLTKINSNLFKQFNLYTIINIPHCKILYDIININCKVNILKYKLAATPITSTLEHEENSLCNLIIMGSIQYNILYRFKNSSNNLSLKYIEGFSTSLLVPIGAYYVQDFDINIHIENIDYTLISNSKLYISSNLILQIK